MTPELTAGLVCSFCGADAIAVFDDAPCYKCGKGPEYTDSKEHLKHLEMVYGA